jgi:hypothetical protein
LRLMVENEDLAVTCNKHHLCIRLGVALGSLDI